MQSANQNRARTLAAISGKRAAQRAERANAARHEGNVPFTITNWNRGEGYFRSIAQDVVDDDHDYEDATGRMG
jgi:hypothetical protein